MNDLTEGRDDTARRERLQRVLSRLNRLHGTAPSSGTYGETAPIQNHLYDWSPPSMVELDESGEEAELDAIRRELRRQLPNHHPEVLRVMAESIRADLQRAGASTSSRFSASQHESAIPQSERSLRSQAILQAVRRHPRFSARSREYMQRYVADRAERERERAERSGSGAATIGIGAETRERHTPSTDHWTWSNRRSIHVDSNTNEDSRSRLRRSMLAEPPSNSADISAELLKRAVVYLGDLRRSEFYEDSLALAVDSRFVTNELLGDKHNDFVLDVHSLNSICPTSILARGSKFKGCQRANPDMTPTNHRVRRRWDRDLGSWDTPQSSTSQEFLPRLTLDDPTRAQSNANIPPHAQRTSSCNKNTTPDQWPVEVTIHDVDWERMTLSATMEAQDVPSHAPYTTDTQHRSAYQRTESSDSLPDLINPDGSIHVEPRRVATPPPQLPPLHVLAETKREPQPLKTITTYLEGEILDFRTHTLITENFASTPSNDAKYWRKLEPFRDYTDDELLSLLLSRRFLQRLNEEYTLMRWKERCFVDEPLAGDQNALSTDNAQMGEGCGLTISGFYYICLRRSDGRIEGLYCDPNSSPYQHLVLERSMKESHWWSWEFK